MRRLFTMATALMAALLAPFGSTTLTPSASTAVTPTKVVTIIEENHSYTQMRASMPYLNSLATKYAYATDWHGITYPSLPNYLAIAAGDTFGVTDDNPPSYHQLPGDTVFDQALNTGRTAKSYNESMPANCTLKPATPYAVKHNAWPYFTNSRTRCNTYDVPLTSFASDASNNRLPNVGIVAPNLCNDAHDCTLTVADNWLRGHLPAVLSSTDFTSGRLTVIITADSDDRGSGNKVLTVVLNARLSGKVVTTPLNHYSLTRYQDQVLGVPMLRKASGAPDMKAAFGL